MIANNAQFGHTRGMLADLEALIAATESGEASHEGFRGLIRPTGGDIHVGRMAPPAAANTGQATETPLRCALATIASRNHAARPSPCWP
mgnify:FL=1